MSTEIGTYPSTTSGPNVAPRARSKGVAEAVQAGRGCVVENARFWCTRGACAHYRAGDPPWCRWLEEELHVADLDRGGSPDGAAFTTDQGGSEQGGY